MERIEGLFTPICTTSLNEKSVSILMSLLHRLKICNDNADMQSERSLNKEHCRCCHRPSLESADYSQMRY